MTFRHYTYFNNKKHHLPLGRKYFFRIFRYQRMDVAQAFAHLSEDVHLKPILASVSPPVFTPQTDVYFALLESIVSQQLSVKAADTIFKRFLSLFPDQYPHPELLLKLDVPSLRTVGLSAQKANYLHHTAHHFQANQLMSFTWEHATDEEVVQLLTQIKGVGKWTAEMILIFTLQRPDVFPVDDLGIQQAMIRLYHFDKHDKQLKAKMLERSEPWRPWRTVAARYLWRWKDTTSSVK